MELLDFEREFLLVFLKDKLHFIPLPYRACPIFCSDHNRIRGTWPKLCPLYNHQVSELHIKRLRSFILNKQKSFATSIQKESLFLLQDLVRAPETQVCTLSYVHLTTPRAAASCSASLLQRQQQKADNLSYACSRKE